MKYKVKKYKSTRKYRCPFCRLTATRGDLAAHVEKDHEDMIPEGYNGTRVVYDYINGKNYGTCLICKKPVYEWDDNIARYKNICDNPDCLEALKKKAQGNHFDDPEVQKKMLAARKISGSYKFKDGTIHSYVGTYELRCFEFMDSIGIQGKDIMSPGPTIYYEYKGETHPWILDWMYIPALLCCDVKDGGSNPNNRPMVEYRERQLAKEEAIKKLGQYNYIRLTDNDFGQLLSALADIRYGTIHEDPINHIYIHESSVITETKKIIKGTIKDCQKITDTLTAGDEGKGNKLKEQKEMIYRDIQYTPEKHGGWIELYHSKDSTKDCSVATIAIDVDPEARGTGLASKLVKGAISNMKTLGVDRIEWYCKKTNIASYKLAKKCGFKEEPKLCNKEWWTLYYGKEIKLEVVGCLPSASAHADYVIPRLMGGLTFEDRGDDPAMYFGNTGSEYLVSYDREMNPMFDKKNEKLLGLTDVSRIVLSSNRLTSFSEAQLKEMGEQGLLEALLGREFNGWRELLTEKVVKISDDIDNDFARNLVLNGIVDGIQVALNEYRMDPTDQSYISSNQCLGSLGNVILMKDSDGFYAVTPKDYHLVSNHYGTKDELMTVVDMMNQMYNSYLLHNGKEEKLDV